MTIPFGVRGMWIVIRSSQMVSDLLANEIAAQWKRFVLPSVWDLAAVLCCVVVGALFGSAGVAEAVVIFVATLVALVQVRVYTFGWLYLRVRSSECAQETRGTE